MRRAWSRVAKGSKLGGDVTFEMQLAESAGGKRGGEQHLRGQERGWVGGVGMVRGVGADWRGLFHGWRLEGYSQRALEEGGGGG